MMEEPLQPTSPMSVETEPPTPRVNSDVVATRHLRIVLESITADKNLSEEERKRKIANFGAVLMASAENKATTPRGDTKPVTQPAKPTAPVTSPPATPLPQSKEDKKTEMIRVAILANEEKRSKAISMMRAKESLPLITETPITTPAPTLETTSLPQQPRPEEKKLPEKLPQKMPEEKYEKKPLPVSKPESNRRNSSASVVPLTSMPVQQPKPNAKKKKGWFLRKLKGKKNRNEVRGDFDEKENHDIISERDPAESVPEAGWDRGYHGGVIMNTQSNVSEDSDRSIGTFEQDYIKDIIREQESNYEEDGALSEGTFEQDARAFNVNSECTFEEDAKALNALSEGTFEQDARAMETVTNPHNSSVHTQIPQQAVAGVMPNLSEATFETFEQDSPEEDERNDDKIRAAGTGTSSGSFGSETTFERDMRRKASVKAQDAPAPQLFEAPSIDSVTTFEKEARGRETATARSRSFPQFNDYAGNHSEDATSDCSDNFKQDFSQDVRPVEPESEFNVWETTAAPSSMPKITELQMQLSPATISKKPSLGRRLISKFTCHCA